MIRKSAVAVTAAAALALGTASATSLGTFDDVSFAASSVDLANCEITTDTLDLTPLIPSTDVELATLTTAGITTFAVDTIDLSMLLDSLPATCTGTLADVLFLDGATILETLTDIPYTTLTVPQLTDYSVGDLTDATTLFDAADVSQIRLVVHNDA